jgi:hypothetical protein
MTFFPSVEVSVPVLYAQELIEINVNMKRRCFIIIAGNGYVLAMVGHLKNVSSTFVQMPNRSKSVEFTTVSHTIANTMLAAVLFF